jgi:hypothetical protein
MVPCPGGDTDERQLVLDRDLGDLRQRPVAARDAEGIGVGFVGERRGIVAPAEHARLDSSLPRCGSKLVDARPALPRAWVDQEEAGQNQASIGPMAS